MQKVKYKVFGLSLNLNNRGRRVHRIIELEIPDDIKKEDFDRYPSDNSIDFRDYKEDIDPIIDWRVYEKKDKSKDSSSHFELVSGLSTNAPHVDPVLFSIVSCDELSEDFRNEYIVSYHKMKDSVKGMSEVRQVKIILAAMDLAIGAVTHTYKRQLKMQKDISMIYKIVPDSLIEQAMKEYSVDCDITQHISKYSRKSLK